MEEIWKDVKDFEGLYQVSNLGRVRSLTHIEVIKSRWGNLCERKIKGRVLKMSLWRNGYFYFSLWKNNKETSFSVHRIVSIHFIPNLENKPEVNHKDGNRKNNRIENLEWVTSSENRIHSFRVLKTKHPMKDKHFPDRCHKVIQYDLLGNKIQEFNGIMEAAEKIDVLRTGIGACCRNKAKTCGGFKWKYKDER